MKQAKAYKTDPYALLQKVEIGCWLVLNPRKRWASSVGTLIQRDLDIPELIFIKSSGKVVVFKDMIALTHWLALSIGRIQSKVG